MANFSGLVVPLATGSGVISRPLGSGASVRRQAVQDHAAGVAGAVDRLDQVDQLEREGLDAGGLPGNPDGLRGVIAGKQWDVEGEDGGEEVGRHGGLFLLDVSVRIVVRMAVCNSVVKNDSGHRGHFRHWHADLPRWPERQPSLHSTCDGLIVRQKLHQRHSDSFIASH